MAQFVSTRAERRRNGGLAQGHSVMISGFSEYFPLHLNQHEAPETKKVVDIWRKEWSVPPYVPLIEPEEIPEAEEEEEKEDEALAEEG